MLRGINRQDIFEYDEDYRQMTGCLRSLTERYDEMITRTVPTIHWLFAHLFVPLYPMKRRGDYIVLLLVALGLMAGCGTKIQEDFGRKWVVR